ncbi:ENV1 protein, partial [Sitta europaea]|nr:ENV1 protein [Sitta europaea]
PETNFLWKLLNTTYQVLNSTNPNVTEHCWLCYDIRPPFYEAVGVASRPKRINSTNAAQCLWEIENGRKQGITMQHVSGQGRCIG